MLEVDLEYPDNLHELHNDYPLAPEKTEISQTMLSNYCCNIANMSNYCCNIANEYEIRIGGVNKLVPNLGNKSKYAVYYKNLQLYLSLGMKLIKVYRILKFKQSDWLKNTLILIETKGKMQLINLKRIFLDNE